MAWLELWIDAPSGDLEAVCAHLEDLGVSGLVIEDEADFLAHLESNRQIWDYVDEALSASMAGKSRVTFYLEAAPEGEAALRSIRDALPWPISRREIREEDWANNWKKYYRPIPVGERLLVIPEWEPMDTSDRIPLWLDPGLIFGTGAHPTTRRCLELIEAHVRPGQRVLDLGAGSGILSIAALLLGAAQATAYDIDPMAPAIMRQNAARNGLDDTRLTPRCGDVLQAAAPLGQYDLILANIVADVIIPLAGIVGPLLSPGGRFISAGIIIDRETEVEVALTAAGFTILERYCDEDWISFVCGY